MNLPGIGAALATLLGIATGAVKLARRRARKPADKHVLALVQALGHDPREVMVVAVHKPKPGLRILTPAGRPVAYYTLAQIQRKRRDPRFMAAWQQARGV